MAQCLFKGLGCLGLCSVSNYSHGCLQLSVTAVLVELTASVGLRHTSYVTDNVGKIPIHIIFLKEKIVMPSRFAPTILTQTLGLLITVPAKDTVQVLEVLARAQSISV